jgi:hypothetical protein
MSNLDVEITMDCMVVEIDRPWLHGELFTDAELDSGKYVFDTHNSLASQDTNLIAVASASLPVKRLSKAITTVARHLRVTISSSPRTRPPSLSQRTWSSAYVYPFPFPTFSTFSSCSTITTSSIPCHPHPKSHNGS